MTRPNGQYRVTLRHRDITSFHKWPMDQVFLDSFVYLDSDPGDDWGAVTAYIVCLAEDSP